MIEDGSRVETIYFLMSEDNVRREIALPWMSFGSDAGAPAPEGVFLKSSPHPRAYGNFANLLGKYVREEHVISLPRGDPQDDLTPATNLGIANRGMLKPGNFADVVVFDPSDDRRGSSTYDKPPPIRGGSQRRLRQRQTGHPRWRAHHRGQTGAGGSAGKWATGSGSAASCHSERERGNWGRVDSLFYRTGHDL